MKTAEILLNICEKVEENPRIMNNLPWDEINECVLSSFYVIRSLYPKDQYEMIYDEITDMLVNSRKCSDACDYEAFINTIGSLILILESIPDSEFIGPFIEEANFNKAYIQHVKNNTVVFVGDSHVNFFSGNPELNYQPIGHDINVCPNITGLNTTSLHLGACLAYTVNKVESSTGFQKKMDYLFENFINPGATIVMVLGESDVRAHIKKQADLQKVSAEKIIDDIIFEYSKYIQKYKSLGYNICVWGPICSQPDSHPLNPSFPRAGTELERNGYAAYFTKQLDAFCNQHQIPFISIYNKLVDSNGRTRSEYLCADMVHLNQTALPMALEALRATGIDI